MFDFTLNFVTEEFFWNLEILELINRDHELLDIIKMVDKKQDEQVKLLNEQTSILNEKLNSLKNMNEAVNERINLLQERLEV